MSKPIGQRQTNTKCCYSNQRPAVTVPPSPPPHNNSNTLQNDVVCLDLSAVAKSTGKYKERFIAYRPRHRNVTEQVLNSGKELAKFEVFRGLLLKLRVVWSDECPLSGRECAHSVGSFAFLTVIHISLRQSWCRFVLKSARQRHCGNRAKNAAPCDRRRAVIQA